MERYVLGSPIGAGGMGTVHLALHTVPLDCSRVVVVKRLRADYARDPDYVAMLVDEARLAARVRHPAVASLLDVLDLSGELMVVMEYVPGLPLSRLMSRAREVGVAVPAPIVAAIGVDVLEGLSAIHEAVGKNGEPLAIVHRDVSPQNVVVGTDGMARVVDLGVAKAAQRAQTTRVGELKGKVGYMAPEQLEGAELDARADLYALGVVLWELAAGTRLFEVEAASERRDVMTRLTPGKGLGRPAHPIDQALEVELKRALSRARADRPSTARDMARALWRCGPAPRWDVAKWVDGLARDLLEERKREIHRLESAVPAGRQETLRTKKLVDFARGEEEQDTLVATALTRPSPTWAKVRRVVGAGLVFPLFGFLVGWVTKDVAALREAPGPATAATASRAQAVEGATQSSAPPPAMQSAAVPEARSGVRPRAAPPAPRRAPVTEAAASGNAPQSPSCAVPYRTNEQGVKIFREECL